MVGLSPVEEEPSPSPSGRGQQAGSSGGGGGQLAAPGWGLQDNLDVIACRADLLYHRYRLLYCAWLHCATGGQAAGVGRVRRGTHPSAWLRSHLTMYMYCC